MFLTVTAHRAPSDTDSHERGGDMSIRLATIGLQVVLVLVIVASATVLTVRSALGVDTYSSYYTVDDALGNDYTVRAMVRNTPYSDHIYASSFWLNIDVLGGGQLAVCENYDWMRSNPYPYFGNQWGNGYPFPLDSGDAPTWAWKTFYADMYWSGSDPVRILHETAGDDVCGSSSAWIAAGVAMYRFPTYWYHQGT
jgi:hypothetical protein